MVEKHVGKKRRKEVQQAVTLHKAMRKTLSESALILVFGVVIILGINCFIIAGAIPPNKILTQYAPLIVIAIACVVAAPKASEYWKLREKYKDHLERYNISKEDMAAMK